MKKLLVLFIVFVVVGIIPALAYVDYGILVEQTLAEGVGRTVVIGILACLGLLYKRGKNAGFAIAAALFTILTIVAESNMAHMQDREPWHPYYDPFQ